MGCAKGSQLLCRALLYLLEVLLSGLCDSPCRRESIVHCRFLLAPRLTISSGEVRLFEERSVNRTRTAYVDMSTRKMAMKSCKIQGHIFGLRVGVELAVPDEDPSSAVDDH